MRKRYGKDGAVLIKPEYAAAAAARSQKYADVFNNLHKIPKAKSTNEQLGEK